MNFKQPIYFGEHPLILTQDIDRYIRKHPESANYLAFDAFSTDNLRAAKQYLKDKDNNPQGVLMAYEQEQDLSASFRSCFTFIAAAGGIVTTNDAQVLMIFRREKWDLPKGKVEPGEPIDSTALREVKEETGLSAPLKLIKEICQTHHSYLLGDADVLKTTHWFLMKTEQAAPLTPQAEEDITKAVWVLPQDLPKYRSKSWKTIQNVLSNEAVPFDKGSF